MRLLLDTDALVFVMEGGSRLGPGATRALQEEAEESLVSQVSLWEIATKRSIGKSALDVRDVLSVLQPAGLRILPIEAAHIVAYQELPRLKKHRDPFDRMLVAQARYEGLTFLTSDAVLGEYGVPFILA